MRVILLGPPGSGKGTQASRLADSLDVPRIATGDMFRDNLSRGTELGKQARSYMDKGELVPDEVVVAMVRNRLDADDCTGGYVLDGFPRTVAQAEALKAYFDEHGQKVDRIINLQVPDEPIIRRLSGRRVCSKCQEAYHIEHLPPDENGNCKRCGGKVIQRDDDKPEVVSNRLSVYRENTEPLISWYSMDPGFHNVNGNQDIESVVMEINQCLGESDK